MTKYNIHIDICINLSPVRNPRLAAGRFTLTAISDYERIS
jgi:hypothetical protein